MTCCIKKYPYDPVGACGATASGGPLLRVFQVVRGTAPMALHDVLAKEKVMLGWVRPTTGTGF